MCGGRHNDKNGCDQPYLTPAVVEAAVARYYGRTVKIPAERLSGLREDVLAAFRGLADWRERQVTRFTRRVTELEAERRKLLQLQYADKVPADLFDEEQEQITAEVLAAENEVGPARMHVDQPERRAR